MTLKPFAIASPFLDKKKKADIPVIAVTESSFKKQSATVKKYAAAAGFTGKKNQTLVLKDCVLVGVGSPCGLYDLAYAVQTIRQNFSKDFIKAHSFSLEGLKKNELTNAHLGWALACYQFSAYKAAAAQPALVWAAGVDKKRVRAMLESIFTLRDLVNAPSNDMGPEELERAARALAKIHDAKISVIKEPALKKDFPLVYTVGHGSERRPRLIDLSWGKANAPKVTLVGKGVAFDTGGVNIKPAANMALMKKDMGGAAHVLALGHLIMSLGLKVNLRILIPAVENSVGGGSFRPGDIIKSRKGITVENTNTDAEGRLILADSLAYACEDRPELLIDFATLTGSARAALGPDIPAMFSNNDALAERLKKVSATVEDQVWPMPLWQPYKKYNDSPIADCMNSSGVPGDLMYSALFLQQFVTEKTDWIHLDCYAWEHTGRPGRPRGGADTGLRAVFALIEDRYG